jgi:sugar phosphate isomerase/epimerase
LARYPLSASVENMSKSHGFSLRKLELIMKKYPEMGFCLDVGHAYRYTPQHTKMIVDKFKERIKQVHLHAAFRRKDHLSLRKASKRFLKSIRPIFSIDVPIIIEEDIKQKNARLLRSELAFVQKYLRSITTT